MYISGACAGFLKGVGEESTQSAGFEENTASKASGKQQAAAGSGGAASGFFFAELHAKPVGYQ